MITERVYHRADDVRELSVPSGVAVTGWELVPPMRG